MGTVLIIFAIVFVLGPIAKAYADRIAKDTPSDSLSAGPELARLREEVDRLSMEVARLQDEQTFMVRLLSEGDRRRLQEGREDTP
jgi:hypothetical protein